VSNANPRQWSALIVEPEKARTAVLTELLRTIECSEIIIAKDAESALAHLEFRSPRVVLCAGRMPGVDGFEFTRRLRRATNVRNCEVSVILTIAGPERSDVISALNAGADSMLPFPMSVTHLRQLLSALDTQKRPFVRAATYVGPCRRRGLVQADGEVQRRLEDFGAAEALGSMMEALRKTFAVAQRGDVPADWVDHASKALATYLTEARGDTHIDEAALRAQCLALIGQFVTHAPGQATFEHAFTPLRRLLTNVVARSQQQAAEKAKAA
jgi:two-component system, chemotaxis family, chemotaxis protein CheY